VLQARTRIKIRGTESLNPADFHMTLFLDNISAPRAGITDCSASVQSAQQMASWFPELPTSMLELLKQG
jgi:hypothetical protein